LRSRRAVNYANPKRELSLPTIGFEGKEKQEILFDTLPITRTQQSTSNYLQH